MAYMIVSCLHVLKRIAAPSMLWIDLGKIAGCMCLECAEETNVRHADEDAEPIESLIAICEDHARLYHIPVGIELPDGFYNRIAGRWVKQLEVSDSVN